ncbi:tripartite tricarboxylate transporter TctB family protein [Bosea sp. (in: a-proteobacteria)]|uniref:tripartite tricarboxylate transporter TctB family protein n=1 Tax=Bosea sp. (in: a-proteobacteria) TaxID=1871050 RepID=UPI00260A090B|nr:tripartite tricarboxylate transporter TctB family protein [Bosea sp. (in: a-proteobacteria)]MCO5089478.1 tripartite tricarboxylate transporter TctB family protein [Bosea sp. (in: a-proteobacteria)]
MSGFNFKVAKPKDLILGIIFLLLAASVVSVASGYNIGTARQMEAGYVPIIMGCCLGAIALILIGRSFFGENEPTAPFSIRPTVYVLGSTILFALLIGPLGLPITVFLVVLLSALADDPRRPASTVLVLAAFLAAGTTLMFPIALEQQIPIVGYLFDR